MMIDTKYTQTPIIEQSLDFDKKTIKTTQSPAHFQYESVTNTL
jgi:hypothetical protein